MSYIWQRTCTGCGNRVESKDISLCEKCEKCGGTSFCSRTIKENDVYIVDPIIAKLKSLKTDQNVKRKK